jgi:hypothetical protein
MFHQYSPSGNALIYDRMGTLILNQLSNLVLSEVLLQKSR